MVFSDGLTEQLHILKSTFAASVNLFKQLAEMSHALLSIIVRFYRTQQSSGENNQEKEASGKIIQILHSEYPQHYLISAT